MKEKLRVEIPHAHILALVFGSCQYCIQSAPWRAFAVVLVSWLFIGMLADAVESIEWLVAVVFGFLLFFLPGLELWLRRTYIIDEQIVKHYGLFGHIREVYPINEVRGIQVSFPLWSRLVNVGDINILGYGWRTTLLAVWSPQENAAKIDALSRRSPKT